MPDAWSQKDERQYRHIFESALWRGHSRERAKEIAARTVNKQRRLEGRAHDGSSSEAASTHLPLQLRTKKQLLERAAALKIARRTLMTKQELIDSIRRHHQ